MPYTRSIVYIKGKKEDLSDFEHGLVAWLVYWEFHAQTSLGLQRIVQKKRIYSVSCRFMDEKCLIGVSGQRRMGRVVTDNKRATVTQITARGTTKEHRIASLKAHVEH